MTDPGMADATYLEPLNAARMTEIIERERRTRCCRISAGSPASI